MNEALREGLSRLENAPARHRRRSYTKPMNLGRPLVPDVDDVAEVLAYAEGEDDR